MLKYLAVAMGVVASSSAVAEDGRSMPPGCDTFRSVESQLAEKHRETPAAIGLSADGSLLTIFATPDGKTWTAILTDANGVACVVDEGRNWEMRVAPKGDPA